jgi:Co/Zn/Cd efflux system component
MSACCSGGCDSTKPSVNQTYRRILWIALVIDAANYAVSLFVLGLAPIWRSRTALIKGLTMGGYGLFVLGMATWHLASGTVPEASTMGTIGFMALIANFSVAVLLFAYRNGDSNMRSVWLCTRNDAIGNVAVMLAALGVFGTSAAWPDIVVASIMGVLGLTAARTVIAQALRELKLEADSVSSQPKATTIELKRR